MNLDLTEEKGAEVTHGLAVLANRKEVSLVEHVKSSGQFADEEALAHKLVNQRACSVNEREHVHASVRVANELASEHPVSIVWNNVTAEEGEVDDGELKSSHLS